MSIIKLKTLKWDNMYSFGSGNVLQLDSEILNQITAPNGYGKSSIPLILEEVLYNKNSKGVPKSEIANRAIGSSYSGEVLFSKDVDEYIVKLSRTGTSVKVSLFKNGVDISSHTATATYKEIEDILGHNFKSFQQLIYQNAANSLQFLEATDSTRKKFLIDLFDMSEYLEYHDIFKKDLQELDVELKIIRGTIDTINASKSRISIPDIIEGNSVAIPDEISSERLGELKATIDNADSINKSILHKKATYNKEIARRDEAENLIKAATAKLGNISIEDKADISSMQIELGSIQADSLAASKIVNSMKSLGDTCPTCTQAIDLSIKSKLIEQNQEIIDTNNDKYNNLNKVIQELKNKNKLIDEYLVSKSKYDSVIASLNIQPVTDDEALVDITNLQQEYDKLKIDIDKNKLEIANAIKHNNLLESNSAAIAAANKHLSELSEQMAELQLKISPIEQRIRDLTILKEAFGPNGLVAYKLENMVKDFEETANNYLSILSSGRFVLEFKLEGDKLNVNLFDNSNLISTSSVSTGERARINLSILLAIRSLMSSISKNHINVLFLDEVISFLDPEGLELLVEVLIQEHGLNSYLVAHSWSHPLVKSISIVKDKDNISRIVS